MVNTIKKVGESKIRFSINKSILIKALKRINISRLVTVLVMVVIIALCVSTTFGASDPTLVTKLNSALKKIQGYLVKLATPAAGVAIATGVLIRKFSFGNEEKMIIGKRVIINAIICYGIIISINLIIKFVESLVG